MIHTLFDELLLWFKRLGCKNYGIKALKVSFILQFSKISNHSESSSWVFQTMPLKTNRQMLAWLWILPTTSKWKKVSYIIFSFILFTSNVGALVTSYVYFAKNLSTDLEEALYAMLQVKAILFFFNLWRLKWNYFHSNGTRLRHFLVWTTWLSLHSSFDMSLEKLLKH